MDLRGLEAVIAIYEHGSFSGAAGSLYLTQPALTRRIAVLERELGIQLFVRTPRGVYATAAGRALVEPGRAALRETRRIRVAIEEIRGGARGSLTITGVPNLSEGVLGRLVGVFHEAFPEVELRVATAASDLEAAASVEAGRYDLALVELPLESRALEVLPIGVEDFLAVITAGTLEAGPEDGPAIVTRELLRNRTIVHLPTASFPKQRGAALFDMVGARPSADVEVSHCGLFVPFIRVGRSVGILPRSSALRAQSEGLELAVPPHPITRSVGFAHQRGTGSPTVRQFLALAAHDAAQATERAASRMISVT